MRLLNDIKWGFSGGFQNTQDAPGNSKLFSLQRLELVNADVRYRSCKILDLTCPLNSPG